VDKRDYYEVLGVGPDADAAALKRAYRQLALKYHPDRNSEDPQADALFKEATEAYGVLSDPEKRHRYDRGGHAAVDGRGVGFDPSAFADFGDLFSAFNSIFGVDFGGSRRPRATRGDDLLHELTVSFEDAARGAEREVRVPRHDECETCAGSGAEKGSGWRPCGQCGGRGQVILRQGFISLTQPCGRCRGRGSVLEKPCATCAGGGRVRSERVLKVRIPGGIADGQRIRLTGEGDAGALGGGPGDLYLLVNVQEHPIFRREGFDLHLTLPLAFPQAALGATVEVPTLDGPAPVDVAAGTESGDVVRLKGRGVRKLSQQGCGDLLVHVWVRTPKRLSAKQQKLLRQYAETLDERYDVAGEKGLLERMKNIFA
jgi:molecular chaperone DnaJ